MMQRILLSISILLLFYSCKEAGPGPEPPADLHNAFLRISIHHVYDSITLMDSLVPKTNVKVYESREDMIFDENRAYERTSDSMGEVNIPGVNFPFAYVRAFHPGLGIKLDSVSTPDNTVSFLEVYY